MIELSDPRFRNPIWYALHGPHRHLALGAGKARRYPAEVAPFAAMEEPSAEAQRELHALMRPGESIWIKAAPDHPGFRLEQELDCVQMILPGEAPLPPPGVDMVPLGSADAAAMVALTDVAFPGFFRPATYRMGSYFGVRLNGQLIAMAGERLRLEGYPELSGICTHPDHRGKGLAAGLVGHLAQKHRRESQISWLHVGAPNVLAIDLYLRLGFERLRNLKLHRISRAS